MKSKLTFILFLLAGTFLNVATSYSQWQQQTSPTAAKLEALYFFDANVGFTSSSVVTQMYKTTNGGQTWAATGNYPARDIHFVDANNGYASAGAGSPNGTMKKTTNGGTTWSQITPPTSSAYSGVFATSASSVYFINTEHKVISSANSGTTLSSYTIPGNTSSALTDIFFTNTTTGFVSVQGGQVFKTTDSGTTWTALTTNTSVTLNSLYFVNATLGYVAGSAGKVIKTTDGGATWVDKSTGASSAINAIKFYDANNGLAVCLSGRIFRTSDGGDSWVEQASGTTSHLWNVYYLSATSAIIVGDSGTILKNTNVLSLDDFSNEDSKFAVFPNPAKDVLNLEVKNNIQISSMNIYNTLGQLILVVPNAGQTSAIDVSGLKTGTYFVKINSDKGISNSTFIKE